MAGLSNMALWVQVPLQSAAQQPAPSAASMDTESQHGNAAEAADTAASRTPQLQQHENSLQQPQANSLDTAQQHHALPGASWGQMWNQLQALSGFHPRLGVLLEVHPAKCIELQMLLCIPRVVEVVSGCPRSALRSRQPHLHVSPELEHHYAQHVL
jgi:hypothetical protein